MASHSFFCIDGHTCGNPVRVIAGGAPALAGATMSEKRQDFLAHHDWIRTALMFEPRGHDLMSGTILYPPTRDDADIALLFIETTGCLPMCGHGTIGTVTLGLEHGLITPALEGKLALDVPAGLVGVEYEREGNFVSSVRIFNVGCYLAAADVSIEVPGLGEITLDVGYGGNFYAIIDPQKNFPGLSEFSAADVLRYSPVVRELARAAVLPVHPEDATVRGVTHVMWTGEPTKPEAHGRNAVFYGDHAIDRSPCGTGTSARMAQWAAKGKLKPGDEFIHESIIGSLFHCRVEEATTVGKFDAIKPSIAGWARMTGLNTIFVDERDPFAHGFSLA
jgi:4-hydroxyproline epimerase